MEICFDRIREYPKPSTTPLNYVQSRTVHDDSDHSLAHNPSQGSNLRDPRVHNQRTSRNRRNHVSKLQRQLLQQRRRTSNPSRRGRKLLRILRERTHRRNRRLEIYRRRLTLPYPSLTEQRLRSQQPVLASRRRHRPRRRFPNQPQRTLQRIRNKPSSDKRLR